MDELREKCPWDRKQTIESIRHLSIEEVFELSDAILEKDYDKIRKELGDILLHVVFYAKIASETNAFTMDDVITGLCEKLIQRHPHIYGQIGSDLKEVKTEEEVKENWERIKLKEGSKSVLSGVPNSLPALLKSYRMQEKAAGVGFDWPEKKSVWLKVMEEQQEFLDEDQAGNQERATEELGDYLFSIINYARFCGINPEDALEAANRKFKERIGHMEQQASLAGKFLHQYNATELDAMWNAAKHSFRNGAKADE